MPLVFENPIAAGWPPQWNADAAGKPVQGRAWSGGKVIIGKNDGWKQGVNLGRRTNQTFVMLPHAQFIHMLTYKAELHGIAVILTEESYTSKCSFLDAEPLGHQERYVGRRVHRGLFQAADGRRINADVNGAANIIRKVAPAAFGLGSRGPVVHPVRLAA